MDDGVLLKCLKHAKPQFQIHPTLVTTLSTGRQLLIVITFVQRLFSPPKLLPTTPAATPYGLDPICGINIFRATVTGSVSF